MTVPQLGCRRQAGDTLRFTSGYVRIDDLVHKHPGWQDVLQLDKMIAHASSLPQSSTAPASGLPASPMPQPLQRRPLLPAALTAEKKRIQAVQYPVRDRMNRLRNSTNVRIERAVTVREKELQSTLEAERKQRFADIREEARIERIQVDDKWYLPIRDLKLQVFALESQVATYRPVPASPAFKISEERHARKVEELTKAEAEMNQALAAIDLQLTQKLARAEGEIRQRFADQIAAYRTELESTAQGEASERLEAMQRVLAALEPLERPAVPPAPEMRAMTIPSPGQIAAASTGAAVPPLRTESEVAAIKEQRKRLAQYLEKDVKRRLNRLATQHRWQLAFGPRPDLQDITSSAAALLIEEWTP